MVDPDKSAVTYTPDNEDTFLEFGGSTVGITAPGHFFVQIPVQTPEQSAVRILRGQYGDSITKDIDGTITITINPQERKKYRPQAFGE